MAPGPDVAPAAVAAALPTEKTLAMTLDAPPPREALDPVDAAWFHIDGPANPAVVIGVTITRSPVDYGRLRALVQRRLLSFARFRQRVVEGPPLWPAPAWEDVPDFDLDEHLHLAALPAPRNEATLRAFLDELASTPLDRSRPLWQMVLIERVGRGSALVLRYHHCIGDGRAMMNVGARLFDMPAAARPPTPPRRERQAPPGLADRAALAARGAATLVGDLLKWPDPPSPFKGDFVSAQRVAWSAPLPLAQAKAIGAAHGARLNDVLVAAVAGALRDYLRRRGAPLAGRTLRAMVPVDLRPPEKADQLGNDFGLVILELPIDEPRSVRRLALVRERMAALKHSAEPLAMWLLFDLFGRGPKALQDVASQWLGSKASVVMTNVVGPRAPVRLAGAEVERLLFCVPHPGVEVGMGLSILSYAGQVTLGVIADARRVPDPEVIARGFERAWRALARAGGAGR